MRAPIDPRTEYDAVFTNVARPRLSWRLPEGSQVAYQVLVAATPEALATNRGDVWDSGRVTSDESVNIPYGGKELPSQMRVYWKVRVWNAAGAESPYSNAAAWETTLLNPLEWDCRWITGYYRPVHAQRPGAAYLRKVFKLDKPLARARLYATARGIYLPYLNGKRVGDELYRPGWTDYNKRIQYQTYDVTAQLRLGENAFGFILNSGWYSGDVAWMKEIYGTQTSVFAQIVVTHTDGSTTVIPTDETWKMNIGAVVTSNFLMGESYDARYEMSGWTSPGYDDGKWQAAARLEPASAELVPQVGPSIRRLMELEPKSITEGKAPGTYLVDMGQNMVGFLRLKVKGATGTTVIIRHAEMLDADGTIYVDNLRKARATDQYTLRGDPAGETYEPLFAFHGFRYAEISGWPGELKPEHLTGVVIGTQTPRTGTFECGVPMLNQLQHNIEWGQRGNFVEVPTDCPQRDERLGWMADIQVFVRTAAFNADIIRFMTKWLTDVIDAQSANGAFSDISPVFGKFTEGAPAWGDAGCVVPWAMYERYGDRQLLARQFDSMRRWVDYLDAANPDHLWTRKVGNNYGDWLSIEADTPKDVLSTAYFAHSTGIVADAARVLGNTLATSRYEALAHEIRDAFIKAYVREDGKINGETQTVYLLGLSFGLLPEKLRAKALEHLVADIHARKDHLSTGFVGVSLLLPTLADRGHLDLAVKLLMNETFPSWGYSIRHGATTIWERWDGWTQEKGFQSPAMNSFNHYAYGSCGDFMYRYLAGINPDISRPGYKHAILRPRVHRALKHVSASYASLYGTFESKWSIEGETVKWDVSVPPNTTATAYVPGGSAKELVPGRYELVGRI